LIGASEIEIRPTGTLSFSAFTCQLKGCHADDYVFTPGTANQGGKLLVSDPDFNEKHGIYDLGTITFDAPQTPGTMPLVNCNLHRHRPAGAHLQPVRARDAAGARARRRAARGERAAARAEPPRNARSALGR